MALLIASQALVPNLGLALVAVVMALGGMLNARPVAETMSRKITCMNAGQGFTANLVTALLVTLANRSFDGLALLLRQCLRHDLVHRPRPF